MLYDGVLRKNSGRRLHMVVTSTVRALDCPFPFQKQRSVVGGSPDSVTDGSCCEQRHGKTEHTLPYQSKRDDRVNHRRLARTMSGRNELLPRLFQDILPRTLGSQGEA